MELNHTIVYMVALRDDAGKLIGYYEKHEYRNRETRKIYDLEANWTLLSNGEQFFRIDPLK